MLLFVSFQFSSGHPTYPLGAGTELKGDAVVGLREIYWQDLYTIGSPLL